MSDQIRVKVTKCGNRPHLIMYYDCPITGKRTQRTTGTASRREAVKLAGAWEAELRAGKYKPASSVTWPEFRERYETEVVPSLADKTAAQIATVFNSVERLAGAPKRLRSINAEWLSRYQAKLRETGVSEATIESYLSHLKAALKWAVELEWLPELPKVKMPKRARRQKVMKGRPITGEEFDRMLAKVEAGLLAVRPDPGRQAKQKRQWGEASKAALLDARKRQAAAVAESWRHLLRGLYLSGLRLGEALNLWWDDRPDKITVDLSGRRPMFRIRAELEKGGQDRLLPMTPDFAAFLLATPEAERRGPVFRPIGMRGQECRQVDYVSKTITDIGKAAGVKVNTDARGKVKYASAHDLRRSFGARWAPKVMPAVLQQLMRHESIETTLKYYVGQNAEATADAVWNAWEEAQNGKSVSNSVSIRPQEASGLEGPGTETLWQ